MFQLFKKKDLIEDKLYAPVIGQAILLENVPDNMFAQKILGDGVGFAFEGDTIYSPCDSEVVMIAGTKHAFGIKMGCQKNFNVIVWDEEDIPEEYRV